MPFTDEAESQREDGDSKAILPRIDAVDWSKLSGVRLVVASFAILCGVTGVMAGCFEISQGNIETEGFFITTIDPDHTLAGELTYFAVTVIPNMVLTGIAAIITSTIAVIWAVFLVQRRHGPSVLFGLFIAQTLAGGGWILDMAIITVILATRIGKPMSWWREHLIGRPRAFLDRLLFPSIVCYAVVSFGLIALTVMMIDDPSWSDSLDLLATIMFVPMVLMILGALAHDVGEP
jgi:hypothetical protein